MMGLSLIEPFTLGMAFVSSGVNLFWAWGLRAPGSGGDCQITHLHGRTFVEARPLFLEGQSLCVIFENCFSLSPCPKRKTTIHLKKVSFPTPNMKTSSLEASEVMLSSNIKRSEERRV